MNNNILFVLFVFKSYNFKLPSPLPVANNCTSLKTDILDTLCL